MNGDARAIGQPPPQSARALWLGRAALTVAMLLGLGFALYAARHLPQVQGEPSLGEGPAGRALAALLQAMASGVWPGRMLSVICLAAAMIAIWRFAAAAVNDPPGAGLFAAAWVLFPTVVAFAALALPPLPVAALIGLALAGGTAPGRQQQGLGALALLMAALLDPLGAWSALGTGLLLIQYRRDTWTVVAPALGAAMGVIATVSGLPPDPGLVQGGHPVLYGAILPFAMLWVGGLLGLLASRSRTVQTCLGSGRLALCRAAGAVFLFLIARAGWQGIDPGSAMLSAGIAAFPLGLTAALPLLVWVRTAMPRVRALGAWIAFPVLMYYCFWAVIGPMRRDLFPYRDLPLRLGGPVHSRPAAAISR